MSMFGAPPCKLCGAYDSCVFYSARGTSMDCRFLVDILSEEQVKELREDFFMPERLSDDDG